MRKIDESEQPNEIIKDFFLKIFALRYFYIITIALLIAAAFFYNEHSAKVYENSTTITPVEDDRTSILYSNNYFQGLGGYSPVRPIENDITNLMSFSLISSTLNDLNFEVGYFIEKGKILKQNIELYDGSPIKVTIDKSHIQPIDTRFYIQILSDSTFSLTASNNEVTLYNYIDNQIISKGNYLNIDSIYRFNKTIYGAFFSFVVTLNREVQPTIGNQELMYFEFYNLDILTKQYLKRIIIGPISTSSSIINIRLDGKNNQKIVAFLNKFVETYLSINLRNKNKIAESTINFIDTQISEISDSLVMSESKLRNYRSANQVMDLSVQGQRLYDQLAQIETDRTNLKVQERYYNSIINYFRTNTDMSGIVPPSAMNVADPIMNQLITELHTYNSQRAEILSSSSEKNLFIDQIESKIKLQKNAIIEHVTNNLNTLNISLNELNYRFDKVSNEISNIPRTELNMVSMQRKYTLNDAIYTYLLQKRSEAQITLASNYPDYELLEPAREVTAQVKKPREKINYLMALFFALVIPTGYLIIREFFNNKVTSIRELEVISNIPVIGSIYSNIYKTESVVSEYPESSVAESFRNLRSNLLPKLVRGNAKVILVTSSQPQDGKSFISYNLAFSIASVGHKTIILDCDLRKPTLHKKFKQENLCGLSNFMIRDMSLDEIKRSTSNKNLTFIPAGPMIPNPSELIEAGTLNDLIEMLIKQYDYVILDTTPIGIVSEAVILMKYANQILLICRNAYTRKDILSNSIKVLNSHDIDNYNVVFNDLNLKKSAYSKYSNYYK